MDKPATVYPMLLQMQIDAAIDIPPGESNFVVTDEFTLPIDVDLLGIYPHAHYLGRDLLAAAVLLEGTTKTLIHIRHWDLNWQAAYRYAEPVFLPKNTLTEDVLSVRQLGGQYRESEPSAGTCARRQSTDEMAHLWLQALPKNDPSHPGDPRIVLQEAWARHEVDKAPGSFESRYNLGEMLQARGALDEAVEQFQAALAIRPNDAIANNALAKGC
jgi:hypothetical protein